MYETLSSGFESQKSWCLKLRSNVSWDWSSIYECSLCLKYLIFYFQEFICLFYQIHRWLFVNLQIRQNCFYSLICCKTKSRQKHFLTHGNFLSSVIFHVKHFCVPSLLLPCCLFPWPNWQYCLDHVWNSYVLLILV